MSSIWMSCHPILLCFWFQNGLVEIKERVSSECHFSDVTCGFGGAGGATGAGGGGGGATGAGGSAGLVAPMERRNREPHQLVCSNQFSSTNRKDHARLRHAHLAHKRCMVFALMSLISCADAENAATAVAAIARFYQNFHIFSSVENNRR